MASKRLGNILTRVVREDCGVTSSEVEGTGIRATNEDSGAGLSLVEVQPLLSLDRDISIAGIMSLWIGDLR